MGQKSGTPVPASYNYGLGGGVCSVRSPPLLFVWGLSAGQWQRFCHGIGVPPLLGGPALCVLLVSHRPGRAPQPPPQMFLRSGGGSGCRAVLERLTTILEPPPPPPGTPSPPLLPFQGLELTGHCAPWAENFCASMLDGVSSVLFFPVAASIMDKFLIIEKALLPVTTDDLITSVMYFRWTGSVPGKRKATVYNEAQQAASSLGRIAPLSQQRALIAAATRGTRGTLGATTTIRQNFFLWHPHGRTIGGGGGVRPDPPLEPPPSSPPIQPGLGGCLNPPPPLINEACYCPSMTAGRLWARLGSSFGDNGSTHKPMEDCVVPIDPVKGPFSGSVRPSV